MITCNFMGGLGNNLFQLAALYNIHKKYKIPYYIKKEVDRESVANKFDQSVELEFENLFENKFIYLEDIQYDEKQNHDYFHHDLRAENGIRFKEIPVKDNTRYNGYFQSEKYFQDFDIKKEFILNKKIKNSLKEKYQFILEKKTISLHYRLGGDRVLQNVQHFHKNVEPSFYEDSIKIIANFEREKIENYNILLFSDNMEKAKNLLQGIQGNIIPINNSNNIEDFILMSLCDNNILGNSTFSWWSAYFNNNPNKNVIVPKTQWVGEGYKNFDFSDYFPNGWILL